LLCALKDSPNRKCREMKGQYFHRHEYNVKKDGAGEFIYLAERLKVPPVNWRQA
jgi:hypothetical protein